MKKCKVLILFLCAGLLVFATVLGTLAYLTSQETVVNTFTVGKVNITLDEAKVKLDGTPDGTDRVQANSYHLLPGMTYTKDPMMTVVKDSEPAYVRMLVTINCLKEFDAIFAPEGADLMRLFNGYDAETWNFETKTRDEAKNTITYEFRYKEPVAKADTDTELKPLFTSITVPGTFNSEDMKKIAGLKITVVGHAIQAPGFKNADEAWTAFATEHNG